MIGGDFEQAVCYTERICQNEEAMKENHRRGIKTQQNRYTHLITKRLVSVASG
jgi:hypothetical protein